MSTLGGVHKFRKKGRRPTIFYMLAPNVCGFLPWKFMSPFWRLEFWSGS